MRNIDLEVKSAPVEHLTDADLVVLRDLTARGFSLAVWTPEEIDGLDATDIEEVMIAAAADYIQNNQDNRF